MANIDKEQKPKRERKPKPGAPANETATQSNEIVATEVEVVPEEETEEEHDKALQTTIKNKVAKFDTNKEKIAAWKEQYKGLTITGLDDKAGLKKVKEAKAHIRGVRTGVEKKRKTLNEDILKEKRAIDDVANEYKTLLEDVEAPLDQLLKQYDEWEDAEKKRKEEEASRILDERVEKLKAAGMVFNGSYYVIGDSMSMDISSIKTMSAFDFDALEAKVKIEKQRLDDKAEQERIEAEEKAAKEKAEREEFEKKQQELREQQEELARKQREFDAQQQQLQEQTENLRKEKSKQREQQCIDIGLVFNSRESAYTFENSFGFANIAFLDIQTLEDGAFSKMVGDVKEYVISIKAQQEDKEKQEAEEKRIAAEKEAEEKRLAQEKKENEERERMENIRMRERGLAAAGLVLLSGAWLIKNEFDDFVSLNSAKVETLSNEDWDAEFEILQENIAQLHKNTATKRDKVKQDAEAAKSDATKVSEHISQLYGIQPPVIEDENIKHILGGLRDKITLALGDAAEKLKPFLQS